jgi:hypothetical protein
MFWRWRGRSFQAKAIRHSRWSPFSMLGCEIPHEFSFNSDHDFGTASVIQSNGFLPMLGRRYLGMVDSIDRSPSKKWAFPSGGFCDDKAQRFDFRICHNVHERVSLSPWDVWAGSQRIQSVDPSSIQHLLARSSLSGFPSVGFRNVACGPCALPDQAKTASNGESRSMDGRDKLVRMCISTDGGQLSLPESMGQVFSCPFWIPGRLRNADVASP